MMGYIQGQAGDAYAGKWDIAPVLPGGATNWGGSWLGVPTKAKNKAAADRAGRVAVGQGPAGRRCGPEGRAGTSRPTPHAAADPRSTAPRAPTSATRRWARSSVTSPRQMKIPPIGLYDTQIQQAFTTQLTNVETKGTSPDDAFNDALTGSSRSPADRDLPGRRLPCASRRPGLSAPGSRPLPPATKVIMTVVPRPATRVTPRSARTTGAGAATGSRLPGSRIGYVYVLPFFLVFLRSASTRGSTRPGSRCTTPGSRRTTSRAGSGWRTTATCSPTSSSGTPSATRSRSGSSRPSRSCAWRSGIAHLLNYRLRGRTFFRVAILMPYATSLAAATVIFAELFDPKLGMINWVLHVAAPAGRRLAGLQVALPDRGLDDRHLALDRLQRADLPGRHAGDQHRPLRGRRHRRRRPLGSSSATSRCPACGRRSCSRSWSRRSAPPSCSVSRCSTTTACADGGTSNQYQTLGLLMYQQGWVNDRLGLASATAWTMFLIIVVAVSVNVLLARRRERPRGPRRRSRATPRRGRRGAGGDRAMSAGSSAVAQGLVGDLRR